MTNCDAGLIGSSAVMQKLREQIARVAAIPLPILIEGPTGSGKELVAQALHRESRRAGRLVAVNVCAIAESLFEDTMFGHVRGAFSGATADRTGLFGEADRGTLFLDEISGLSASAQSKLLRAIETGVFRPVGARTDDSSDARLLSATSVPLDEAIRAGSFRADLGFRLSGATIRVPALAEHREDIPELARHFAGAGRFKGLSPKELSDGAISALTRQSWPGNIRQLRNTVECALMLSDGPRVSGDDVQRVIEQNFGATRSADDEEERRRLRETLGSFEWDTERTAIYFGVHRASIYRRMRRLGIEAGQRRRYTGKDWRLPGLSDEIHPSSTNGETSLE